MKLSISKEGSERLEKLMSKVSAINPYAQKSISALMEAVVFEFTESGTDAQIESTAGRLTTSKGKQKSLVKTLKNITDKADEETLKVLEKTLKKLNGSVDRNHKNSA